MVAEAQVKLAALAFVCAIPGIWLAFKAGERLAYRNAMVIIQLVADGRAEVNEDGTVSLVEATDFEEAQREHAVWQ